MCRTQALCMHSQYCISHFEKVRHSVTIQGKCNLVIVIQHADYQQQILHIIAETQRQQGMLTLELSVLVLEIPNDAYTTLSRNLIGCSTLRQEYLQADWLIMQNNEKATLNINMTYQICAAGWIITDNVSSSHIPGKGTNINQISVAGLQCSGIRSNHHSLVTGSITSIL